MPGPMIHISAMRATALLLAKDGYSPAASHRINPEWRGENCKQLGELMIKHSNFAALGAIGPDLFFFLPDFRDKKPIPLSSVLVAFNDFLFDLYDKIDPYIEKYEKYLGPISQDAQEAISRLTGGLSEVVTNVLGDLISILISAIENLAVKNVDFFTFFSLGHNTGVDEQSFMWSDMLHYRRTGQFGRVLWQVASEIKDDDLRAKAQAYALGYITHVGTDVTGHALVNTIAGGPFRLHWQRHHLVENHMDAFWYLRDANRPGSTTQYGQLTESALYYDIAFNEGDASAVQRPSYPTGNSMRENWVRRRKLDLDSKLAEPVAGLLHKAIEEVFYRNGKHPRILRDNDGKPTLELIDQTYRLLFSYLKMTTVDGFSHEAPQPPDVFPNLDFPTMSDPQGSGPGGDDSDGSWFDDLLDFLLSVINILAYILAWALYIATILWALAADLATYLIRLAIYYAVELPLFHALKSFRATLVMTGYLMPMKDEISLGLIAIGMPDKAVFKMVMDDVGDVFPANAALTESRNRFEDANYPHMYPKDADGDPAAFHQPWQYPRTEPAELGRTVAGPYPARATPEVLFKNVATDPGVRDQLESAQTPSATDTIARASLRPTIHLGNATQFSAYQIWLHTRQSPQPGEKKEIPYVDWNLDADRGYAYHCWDWNRKPDSTHEDPNGHPFHDPCTWPPQAALKIDGFDPAKRLQLHWTGFDLKDPGCKNDPDVGKPDNGPR